MDSLLMCSGGPCGNSSLRDAWGNWTNTGNEPNDDAFLGPDQSFSHFREHSRFWIQRVLVLVIMIIGSVGNTVTIIIMTRRRMRSSTNNYLAALAIFDMAYLLLMFLLSLDHYPNMKDTRRYVYWRVRPFLLMLTDTASNTSVWLTVTFTIERYIAVCHPIRGKVLCTESRAKRVILAVFLVCFTLTLPTPFEWVVVETINPVTNYSQLRLDNSELGKNDLYRTIYSWMTVVLFIFLPLLLLAVFNSFLIRSVHVSRRQRRTMTRRQDTRDSSRQENKITVMLIAVVILFIVCQLPTAAIILYHSFRQVQPYSNEEALLLGLGNIFNFLMAVNAAGNFVLYCLLSKKYRRTLVVIFCPCVKGHLRSGYQNTTYSQVENESPALDRQGTLRHSTHLLAASGCCEMRNTTAGHFLRTADNSSPCLAERPASNSRKPWRRFWISKDTSRLLPVTGPSQPASNGTIKDSCTL